MNKSMLGPASVRQLVLCGNQALFILKTPSQLLRSLTPEQIDDLKLRRHQFYMESASLFDQCDFNTIDEEAEASSRFTIFEDMIESFLYLNQGHLTVNMLNNGSDDMNGLGFEVRTNDASEVFKTPHAIKWVSLLN